MSIRCTGLGDRELEWGDEICAIHRFLSLCSNSILKQTYSNIALTSILTNTTVGVAIDVLPTIPHSRTFMGRAGFANFSTLRPKKVSRGSCLTMLFPPYVGLVSSFLYSAHQILLQMRLLLSRPWIPCLCVLYQLQRGPLFYHPLTSPVMMACSLRLGHLLNPRGEYRYPRSHCQFPSSCLLTLKRSTYSSSLFHKATVSVYLASDFLHECTVLYDVLLVIICLCNSLLRCPVEVTSLGMELVEL